MTSIAFVSGSKETDGIFRGNFQVFLAAKDLGFPSRWVQCIDPSDPGGNYTKGDVLRGWRLPIPSAEQGLNRMVAFPSRLRNVSDDRVFLGDPTFLNFARGPRADRTVVHVHDLRPLSEFADRWDTRWMFRYALPRLRRARRIMVHTQFVRDGLAEFPGVADKVFILPPHTEHGPEQAEQHIESSQQRLAREDEVKVLYVATDRPHKNLAFFFQLAKAMADETHPHFQFVLVSRLQKSSVSLLEELRPTNLAIVPYAPDVGSVYSHSDILAFPSLYEGFGLPMLEALSFGMPVVANNIEPMKEVLSGGGLFAPPRDIPAWKESLLSLAASQRYESVARRAADRARDFSREAFLSRLPRLFD